MSSHRSNLSAGKTLPKSPFLLALMANQVAAHVIDVDHYRIHGGMAVETDYIIVVQPTPAQENENRHHFDTFTISKTYSSFRHMATTLDKAADHVMSNKYSFSLASTSKRKKLPYNVIQTAKYCDHIVQLIESQKTHYLGKVNYKYVKILAKQRSRVINDTLDATLTSFPKDIDSHSFLGEVASILETFFLTDHIETASSASVPALSPSSSSKKGHDFPKQQSEPAISVRSDSSQATTISISRSQSTHEKDKQEPPQKQLKPVASASAGLSVPKDNKTTTSRATRPASKFSSSVEPKTFKVRRNESLRALEADDLESVGTEATLLLDDDRGQSDLIKAPSYNNPTATYQANSQVGSVIDGNPLVFMVIAIVCVLFLHRAKDLSVTMDVDLASLMLFAAFCIGLHTPRASPPGGASLPAGPATSETAPKKSGKDRAGARLLRRSMQLTSPSAHRRASFQRQQNKTAAPSVGLEAVKEVASTSTLETDEPTKGALGVVTDEAGGEGGHEVFLKDDDDDHDSFNNDYDEDEDVIIAGPMELFPAGAKLGSHLNCYSQPVEKEFSVRGPKYLKDKKKVASGPFIFPTRGVDLFLTDTSPENIGCNSSVFGGNLRDVPTFILNFRLPWGIFVAYYEIPSDLIPYLKAGYDDPTVDRDSLMKKMGDLSPGRRTAARFLIGDDAHRNGTLKIVPKVVQGPWVVKSVVGGKPAILGNKLPVTWVYQPEEKGPDGKTKALYLEGDLDIVSSSAARGILSVARQYTNVLTLDLGFVVQGNQEDELPEQMLLGTRLHGIDPVSAPPLPPMKNNAFLFSTQSEATTNDEDDDSATQVSI